jgi:membrane protease YdiL (CAAX protease family)
VIPGRQRRGEARGQAAGETAGDVRARPLGAVAAVPPEAVVSAGMELAAAALAVGYGVALDRLLPRRFHVLTNPVAAVAITGLARAAGVRRAGQGLHPRRALAGLAAGIGASVPVIGVIAAGLAVPATRRLFRDERLALLTGREAVYEALVRIPIATALAEEIVFRGALLGVLLRRHPPLTAAALSSALFGLWHLLPGSEILSAGAAGRVTATNGQVTSAAATAALGYAPAAMTVLATTAAGWGLAELRLRTGSVIAPTIAHAALNSAALLAGWLVSHKPEAT